MRVTYRGQDRFTVPGSLLYLSGPPPLGTILGPNAVGEYLVVVAHDGRRALCAPATAVDMAEPVLRGEPNSMAERHLFASL